VGEQAGRKKSSEIMADAMPYMKRESLDFTHDDDVFLVLRAVARGLELTMNPIHDIPTPFYSSAVNVSLTERKTMLLL
jgi:hypothetical protein